MNDNSQPIADTTPLLRLLPERVLPPYSYVTGKFPHPHTDARGHSFGAEPPWVAPQPERHWRTCEPYLFGIDLFNHGYYWEAHEQWEAVWKAAGQHGTAADFCKGLIKLAAAGVKAREGRVEGIARHLRRSLELFSTVASALPLDQSHYMGLSLAFLHTHATQLLAASERLVNTSVAPVVRVLPLTLCLERLDG